MKGKLSSFIHDSTRLSSSTFSTFFRSHLNPASGRTSGKILLSIVFSFHTQIFPLYWLDIQLDLLLSIVFVLPILSYTLFLVFVLSSNPRLSRLLESILVEIPIQSNSTFSSLFPLLESRFLVPYTETVGSYPIEPLVYNDRISFLFFFSPFFPSLLFYLLLLLSWDHPWISIFKGSRILVSIPLVHLPLVSRSHHIGLLYTLSMGNLFALDALQIHSRQIFVASLDVLPPLLQIYPIFLVPSNLRICIFPFYLGQFAIHPLELSQTIALHIGCSICYINFKSLSSFWIIHSGKIRQDFILQSCMISADFHSCQQFIRFYFESLFSLFGSIRPQTLSSLMVQSPHLSFSFHFPSVLFH